MFNYAALLGIAKQNNLTAILPKDMLLRRCFHANMTIGDSSTSMNLVMTYTESGHRASTYDRATENLWKHYPYEIVLDGYFQSWKYFQNVQDELRTRHFVFKTSIMSEAKQFYETEVPVQFQDDSIMRVGLHIRRGDHMKSDKQAFGHAVADKAYVQNAMKYFRDRFQKLVFIVCSDDHLWFQREIGDSSKEIVISTGKHPALDMAILSLCNHTIITVGSFGWWSAWLANGTTVYYNGWPIPGSRLDRQTKKKDYFPNHWIPLK